MDVDRAVRFHLLGYAVVVALLVGDRRTWRVAPASARDGPREITRSAA
ncbi:hypothetical protein [Kineococcus sp. SYSU DK003]